MGFQKPRILTDSEVNMIRGKCLVAHASAEEQMQLIRHFDLIEDKFRTALELLQGCMDDRVFIYGSNGEYWSTQEPGEGIEFEEINFKELLGE